MGCLRALVLQCVSFISIFLIHGPHAIQFQFFGTPFRVLELTPAPPQSSRPASPPLSAARSPYLHPQTQLHIGTRDPIHPPPLPLSPHTN
ncbi:hypothetical protein B0H14DRAFT_2784364, partial [Mycena olivaceomarginata]